MPPAAKPNVLTRKVGPAPLWLWALAGAVVVWFVFFRSPSPSSAASQVTQAPVTGSSAGVPDTGATGSTDANGNAGDLLAQLLQGQQDVIDRLTGAVIGGGQGNTGSAGGAGGASATSSAATSSVDSGIAPSSVQQDGTAAYPTTDNSTPQSFAAQISGGVTNADLPPDQQLSGVPGNAYVISSHETGGTSLQTPDAYVASLSPKLMTADQAITTLDAPTRLPAAHPGTAVAV